MTDETGRLLLTEDDFEKLVEAAGLSFMKGRNGMDGLRKLARMAADKGYEARWRGVASSREHASDENLARLVYGALIANANAGCFCGPFEVGLRDESVAVYPGEPVRVAFDGAFDLIGLARQFRDDMQKRNGS